MTIQQPDPTQTPRPVPPGWYPDPAGVTRWWDGQQWTHHTPPPTSPSPYPMVQPNVRQAMDRAQYVRQQQGHSIIKHILFGWLLGWIPTIYYAFSPNHYFHA